MINAKTIEAWLNRDVNNYDWAKQKSEGAYDRHFAKLTPPPDFNGVKLWKHQQAGFTLLNELNRFIFHIGMGGGKTLLTLLFLRYKKQCGQKPRAIVFVPYLTSVETWVEENEKHTPDLRVVPLLGSTKENLAALQQDADLFVICYQSAVAMLSVNTQVQVDDRAVTKWQLSPGLLVTAFGNRFNFMVCDEIHKCFVKGTMIATPAGSKPIEDLKPGDLVETGFGARAIISTMCSLSSVLVEVILSNGVKVKCTSDHLFMTDEGWVPAKGLYGKQISFTESYHTNDMQTSRVRVVNVSVLEPNHPERVFNIEVNEYPQYFANGILVHNCKGRTSLTFDMCKWISQRSTWAIGLTGTPFGKDLQDLWPQFYLIDFGETLGPNVTLYREAFFSQKLNYWGGREYTFRKNMMPQLRKMIKNRSIHYSLDEFYDMPPKNYVPKRLALPEASKSYVRISIDNIKQALKGKDPGAYRVVENEYLILRQLASGFMTLKGEDNERIHVKFDENPKLEALEDLVEQLPDKCKMIIFHHFVYTNSMISELLTKMKIKHARIWGGQRDPVGQLRMFKDTSDCRVLVINSKSGSSSLNLQGANYLVFFEQPDSPIDRQQAEARCWRPGQDKRVFIIDLIVNGTMDERTHYANKAGEDLLKQLLEGKVEL